MKPAARPGRTDPRNPITAYEPTSLCDVQLLHWLSAGIPNNPALHTTGVL